MNNEITLRIEIIAAVLTALCCVTPVLVIGFGARVWIILCSRC